MLKEQMLSQVWVNSVEERKKLYMFLRRLLDPEDLGHAVTAEVRDEVRELLGMKRVETKGEST